MLSVSDVAKLSGKQKPRNYHQVLAFSPTIVLAIRKNPRREGALTAVHLVIRSLARRLHSSRET